MDCLYFVLQLKTNTLINDHCEYNTNLSYSNYNLPEFFPTALLNSASCKVDINKLNKEQNVANNGTIRSKSHGAKFVPLDITVTKLVDTRLGPNSDSCSTFKIAVHTCCKNSAFNANVYNSL